MTAGAATPDTLPGTEFPLGATVTDAGTNSGVADGMLVCLFDQAGAETRIPMRDYDAGVWHVFVPGVGAGQAYGYRATGPYDPARGVRCHPAKLLLDPYARAASGTVTFGPEVLGYAAIGCDAPSETDSAPSVPRSLVVADEPFRWHDSGFRRRPYADTIIYEVHVKGFTVRHPGVPPEVRGTFAGLGHEAALAHLLDLGVTAVELLPVHENIPEAFLVQRGLTNYWGYNTIGYFAPHQGYWPQCAPGGRAARSRSSRRWWTRCTRPGSRSCSMWCSTTPPKAIISARRSATAAWTTSLTTGSTPATRGTTWTRQAAATR